MEFNWTKKNNNVTSPPIPNIPINPKREIPQFNWARGQERVPTSWKERFTGAPTKLKDSTFKANTGVLPFLGEVGKNAYGMVTGNPERVGETLGQSIAVNTGAFDALNKANLQNEDIKLNLVKRIIENKKLGKDNSKLIRAYNNLSGSKDTIQSLAPKSQISNKQALGEVLDVGAAALSMGALSSVGKATLVDGKTALQSFKLLSKTAQKEILKSMTAEQIVKNLGKEVLVNSGIGYAYDVSGNLKNDEKGIKMFKPGLGTVLGATGTALLGGPGAAKLQTANSEARIASKFKQEFNIPNVGTKFDEGFKARQSFVDRLKDTQPNLNPSTGNILDNTFDGTKQTLTDPLKYKSAEEFVKNTNWKQKNEIVNNYGNDYEYHLSTEPNLEIGKTFAEQKTKGEIGMRGQSMGEGVYSTKNPQYWESQLAYEQNGKTPTNLYLVKIKNGSKSGMLESGNESQTLNKPNEIIVVKKILTNNEDKPLDIGLAESMRDKQILTDIWNKAQEIKPEVKSPLINIKKGAFVPTPKAIPTTPLEVRASKFTTKEEFIGNEIQFLNRTKQKVPTNIQEKLSKTWDNAHAPIPESPLGSVTKSTPQTKVPTETPSVKTTTAPTVDVNTPEFQTKFQENLNTLKEQKPEIFHEQTNELHAKAFTEDLIKDSSLTEAYATGRITHPQGAAYNDAYNVLLKNEADKTGNVDLIDRLSDYTMASVSGQKLQAQSMRIKDGVTDIVQKIKQGRFNELPKAVKNMFTKEETAGKNFLMKELQNPIVEKSTISKIVRTLACP